LNLILAGKALKRCSFSSKLDLSIMEELKLAGLKAGYYKKRISK